MNFSFEFFDIHISHLTQLGMINITLKCQKKKIWSKLNNLNHYWTWFWTFCSIFAPHEYGDSSKCFCYHNIKFVEKGNKQGNNPPRINNLGWSSKSLSTIITLGYKFVLMNKFMANNDQRNVTIFYFQVNVPFIK